MRIGTVTAAEVCTFRASMLLCVLCRELQVLLFLQCGALQMYNICGMAVSGVRYSLNIHTATVQTTNQHLCSCTPEELRCELVLMSSCHQRALCTMIAKQ